MVDTNAADISPDRTGSFEALGVITALALASTYHRIWQVRDIEHNILPAIAAGQYKIYLNDERRPAAFVTWAFVDDDSHQNLIQHGHTPPADKWCSGGRLWFIDLLAPFGGAHHVIRDLQRNHFPHLAVARSIRRNTDGTIRRVNIWRNPSLAGAQRSI